MLLATGSDSFIKWPTDYRLISVGQIAKREELYSSIQMRIRNIG